MKWVAVVAAAMVAAVGIVVGVVVAGPDRTPKHQHLIYEQVVTSP